LQSIFDPPPLAQQCTNQQCAQHDQRILGIQKHLDSNGSREETHPGDDGVFQPVGQARAKQHPKRAANENSDDVDDGSGHSFQS